MPGYSPRIDVAAERSVLSLISKGQKRCSCPARANASSSTRVLSDVPEPSSTRVSAPDASTMASASARRIVRSASVG